MLKARLLASTSLTGGMAAALLAHDYCPAPELPAELLVEVVAHA